MSVFEDRKKVSKTSSRLPDNRRVNQPQQNYDVEPQKTMPFSVHLKRKGEK
jgi:hypothetical protein